MPRILTFSDLHIEHESYALPDDMPDFDVAVIAGDVSRDPVRSVSWLASQSALKGRRIVFVMGNSEFYDGDIDERREQALVAGRESGVHVLAGTHVELCGVRFIGATLWTSLAATGRFAESMAWFESYLDSRRPITILDQGGSRRMRALDFVAEHARHVDAIAASLYGSDVPCVVVSHHAPHQCCVDRRFDDPVANAAYFTDLEWLIRAGRPAAWIHGHTHASADHMVCGTRVMSNPKGHGTDPACVNENFDPRLVIDIPTAAGVWRAA